MIVVYYESIKRERKIRCIHECRCDERLQTKTKEVMLLAYTGLVVELEHLKIETRLIDEKFANVIGDLVVYYESIKRELKIRCIYECRCGWKTTCPQCVKQTLRMRCLPLNWGGG